MLHISKVGNSIQVVGEDNRFYPHNDVLNFPLNSIVALTDDSDMVVFKSAANGDVLFSALVGDITISENATTKEDVLTEFSTLSNVATGGGGSGEGGAVYSVNGQTGDVVLTASNVGAYSKTQTDNLLIDKANTDDLEALEGEVDVLNTSVGNLQLKADENAEKIGDLDVEMGEVKTSLYGKQSTLVSGTNIKTINGESVLGSGNITIDADTSDLAPKNQALSVGTNMYGENNTIMLNKYSVDNTVTDTDIINFKTINGESVLGSGNIVIEGGSGGGATYAAGDGIDISADNTISVDDTIARVSALPDMNLYVLKSVYDAKVIELETAISNLRTAVEQLQTSLGNIGTALDDINGEVVQ